jgi:G3E family GTPase
VSLCVFSAAKGGSFAEVANKDVGFDLRGFHRNAKLDIDPDFRKPTSRMTTTTHGEHCDHLSHAKQSGQHHHHDDDVKSFVFRSDKPFSPAVEDF